MSLLKSLQSFLAPRDIFARAGDVTYAQHLLTESNTLDLEIDPLQNSVVAACVNAVARALPDAPLLLENRTQSGWKAVTDHECLRVLRAPNQDHSDADVWGLTSGYKATHGQAFWLLLPDQAGRVGEIHVWNPERVTVLGDESHFISAYRLRTEAGGLLQIPKNQIIHFRHLPDFRNPRLGWSPLRTGRAQIAGDNIGATYHTSLLHNAGVVSLLISLKEGAATGQVTPEQFQQVLTNIRRASRERAGGVEGINLPLEVHKLAYSPDEMNVDKLIQYYETRICAVMGVPQRVAGLGADPTYHNLSEALNDFWERRIVPDRNSDAATLNRQWLPLFGLDDGNWRFRFDFSQVPALQENRDALHVRVRADWEKGLVDKGQARALLGYAGNNESAFQGVFFGEAQAPLPSSQTDEVKGFLTDTWREWLHPRDRRGRFGSGGRAEVHLSELMKASPRLSAKNKAEFLASLTYVTRNIPPHLRQHVIDKVKTLESFNDKQELSSFVAKHFQQRWTDTSGAWNGAKGLLLLDGGENNQNLPPNTFRELYYAHEIGHVLDSLHGENQRISSSPEWLAAFESDLKGRPKALSAKAAEQAKEGFAEVASLVFAPDAWVVKGVLPNSGHPYDEAIGLLRKKLPECYKIFEKEGLIE